jgi:hypothetical protein
MGEVAGQGLDQQPVDELLGGETELVVRLAAAHPRDEAILLLHGHAGEADIAERVQAEAEQLGGRRQARRAIAAADRILRMRVDERREVDGIGDTGQKSSDERTQLRLERSAVVLECLATVATAPPLLDDRPFLRAEVA